MKRISVWLIILYQKTLSLDHGLLSKVIPIKSCKYVPTCSEYTIQALEKYGFFKGWYLGIKRILRCNPWSAGGYDPLK